MSNVVEQVGGDHYATKNADGTLAEVQFQHWDLVARTSMDYFLAAATKYIDRAFEKRGQEISSVKKAISYVKKVLIEANSEGGYPPLETFLKRDSRGRFQWFYTWADLNSEGWTQLQGDILMQLFIATQLRDIEQVIPRMEEFLETDIKDFLARRASQEDADIMTGGLLSNTKQTVNAKGCGNACSGCSSGGATPEYVNQDR